MQISKLFVIGTLITLTSTTILKAEELKWPDTTPIDKTDPNWKFNNNINVNGVQYLKKEVEPNHWQWVIDDEIMRQKADQENSRQALWQALQTRVLTDEEMKKVLDLGEYINIQEMVSYNEIEKQRERGEAFIIQAKLRAIKQGDCSK